MTNLMLLPRAMVRARLFTGACALASALLGVSPASAQAVPTPHANQYGLGLIGAPAAWALGYNGTGVTVAVADSGIDTTHPAFAGKIDNRSRTFTLVAPGAVYDPAAIDDKNAESHGTHVGGIIASSAASGVPGDAYGANLVVLRIFSNCAKGQNCDAPDIPNTSLAAIDYFTGLNNVLIYNASYGPNSGKDQTSWPTSTIDPDEQASILRALAAGKIIVAANGNDREANPVAGVNPNGIALYPFIQPANANAGVYQDGGKNFNFAPLLQQSGLIIAVTSVGQAKTIAPYAMTCGVTASWCVAAPGGDQNADAGIYSTLPPSTFGYQQGTSMAAPMVSGALAVLQQAYPAYAARDLANVLFATAENIGGRAAVNATYGYGLIRLDRAVAGPTTLAAGANVDVTAQQTTYWSQPLTTSGGFNKTGNGYLIVAGRTTAAGDVAVNAGALGVDGTLTLQTQMTVAQDALLAGFGRVIGNTTINGTLNAGQLPNYADLSANNGGTLPAGTPLTGTSPGTLTFQGNVMLTATATTRANIDGALQIPGGPGTYDKIIVTGAGATFTANGTLMPVLRDIAGGNNNYSPAIGATYALVNAQNGAAIAGQFVTLTQPAVGLTANTRLDVVYSATAITFNVTPKDLSNLAAADGKNKNVQNVADALDAIRPEAGIAPRGAPKAVFDDLYDNTAAQDETEFESLSGEGQAANPVAALAAFSAFSNVIADHQSMTTLANAGLRASITPAASGDWTIWAQGFGRWSRTGDDAGLPGDDSVSSGGIAGADRLFASDLRAGVAFGFQRTTINGFGERATSNDYAGAVYATWTPGPWVIDGRFVLGPTAGDTTRAVTVLGVTDIVEGSSDGWGTLLATQVGYRFDVHGMVVAPYAGLTAQLSRRNAFTETSVFGLSFPSQDFARVTSALGVQVATSFDLAGVTIAPLLKAAWTRDMGDRGLVSHVALFGSPFELDAADPGRDAALLGLELNAWQSDNFNVFFGYTGEFRNNATSHGVVGGFRAKL